MNSHSTGDAVEAAKSLAISTWKLRFEIFQERAFLPLDDLSGNVALTLEDITLLKSGITVLLSDDTQGRTVFL
jgi:hypothetical protein